jgi:hypothetical protein
MYLINTAVPVHLFLGQEIGILLFALSSPFALRQSMSLICGERCSQPSSPKSSLHPSPPKPSIMQWQSAATMGSTRLGQQPRLKSSILGGLSIRVSLPTKTPFSSSQTMQRPFPPAVALMSTTNNPLPLRRKSVIRPNPARPNRLEDKPTPGDYSCSGQ